MRDYWSRVARRAWDDASKMLGTSLMRILVTLALTIVASVLTWPLYLLITGGSDPNWGWRLLAAAATATATILALAALCVIGLFTVPPKMERESKTEFESREKSWTEQCKSLAERIDYLERDYETTIANHARQLQAAKMADPSQNAMKTDLLSRLEKFREMERTFASEKPVSYTEVAKLQVETTKYIDKHLSQFGPTFRSSDGLDIRPPRHLNKESATAYEMVMRDILRLQEALTLLG